MLPKILMNINNMNEKYLWLRAFLVVIKHNNLQFTKKYNDFEKKRNKQT